MLTITPAKSIKGNYELPPSPDLLVLAVVSALAARKSISVTPFVQTPLVQMWMETLKGCAHFEQSSGTLLIRPVTDDPSQFIMIPTDIIPYRDLTVFMLLGMGKTLAFTSLSSKRLDYWKLKAKKYGFVLQTELYSDKPGIVLSNAPETITISTIPDEDDLSMLLGIVAGLRRSCSFIIDYTFTSPFRAIAPTFGFELSVKSLAEKENDPLARRIKMMQKKSPSVGNVRYAVNADFTLKIANVDEIVSITLPGDEVLSALLLSSRCLIQKGSFAIGNIPLETWGSPVLSFIRKMGTKITAQETGRTSFGTMGILTMQKIELTGRKLECHPASNFAPYIPSLAVLAAFAHGQSVFRGLEDLRNDDPDGIDLIETCIRKLGARHGEMPDGIVMEGGKDFDGFDFPDALYPALSGAFAIAGLRSMGTTTINDDLLKLRWPDFESILTTIFEFRA